MSKFKIISLIIFFAFCVPTFAHEEENVRDYLYSEEYFDYLIECANEEAIEIKKNKQENQIEVDEITVFEFDDEIATEFEPFKLGIEENLVIGSYSQSFKKEDTKTIIPLSDKFSIVHDTFKFRNKYNSDDYRVLAGAEIAPFKRLNIATGLETNYRGIDQNPISRKLYFTPTFQINDKLSLSFFNKYNVLTHSSDHDMSINLSPFKSKVADFKVYAGVTNYQNGTHSESVNFYTNFYLF